MNACAYPLAVALTCLAARGVAGQDLPEALGSRASLTGLGTLEVKIDVSAEAENVGMSSEELRALIEPRLQQAGIRVATAVDRQRDPAIPWLYVQVGATTGTTGAHAVVVSLKLFQTVSLARVTSRLIWAITWDATVVSSATWFALIGSRRLTAEIQATVLGQVHAFINDHGAANAPR